jgi:hypothetical protein
METPSHLPSRTRRVRHAPPPRTMCNECAHLPPTRVPSPCSTARRSNSRSKRASRSTATSRVGQSLTASSTSTPTCPRGTRSASTTSPSAGAWVPHPFLGGSGAKACGGGTHEERQSRGPGRQRSQNGHRGAVGRRQEAAPRAPPGVAHPPYPRPACGPPPSPPHPAPSGGFLIIDTPEGAKRFGITRAHLEEDAGKSVHGGADSLAGSSHTLVDFNRAGGARAGGGGCFFSCVRGARGGRRGQRSAGARGTRRAARAAFDQFDWPNGSTGSHELVAVLLVPRRGRGLGARLGRGRCRGRKGGPGALKQRAPHAAANGRLTHGRAAPPPRRARPAPRQACRCWRSCQSLTCAAAATPRCTARSCGA